MSEQKNFLWLDGVFDEETVKAYPAISPASNFWQRGFVDALKLAGNEVEVIGHTHERIWPFGRLVIRGKQASLSLNLKGVVIGFINAPFLRGSTRYLNYWLAVKAYFLASKKPDYTVTFSCLSKSTDMTSSIKTAKYIRKHFGVPWVCVVADGVAPVGADAYVYLTWSYYKSLSAYAPKIHIDGGVPEIRLTTNHISNSSHAKRAKTIMYMGALTPHGGSTQLASAFHLLDDEDIELWICGRGENSELTRLAEVDKRIKLYGFVSEDELNKLASEVTAFVNPRPTDFEPNKLNYPSKVLHYLAFGKPVISTFTEGISPEYVDILIPILEESEGGLGAAIQNVLNMADEDYSDMCLRIAKFNETHSWAFQMDRFMSWLQREV